MRNKKKDVLSDLFQDIVAELPEVKAMNESYYLAVANTVKTIADCLNRYEELGSEQINITDLQKVLRTNFIEAHDGIKKYYAKLMEGEISV